MQNWRRREFLGASLAGLTASSGLINASWAASKEEPAKAEVDLTRAPDTLLLTWQSDPTTTITVQWLDLNTPARGKIYIAELGGSEWTHYLTQVRPFQKTEWNLHRCEVTGLKPDTEYQLRVSGTRQVCRFRTMPVKATDTIQFVSGGDCGTGKAAQLVNRVAASQDPRFALVGGDLAYDNGKSPEIFVAFLRNWRAQMVDSQGRIVPMLSCIGNHEVDGHTTDRAQAPQYLSIFDGFYPEKTYGVVDIGDYLSLVLLDTDHLCPIEGEQTDWLEKTLAEREDRPHVIVAYHVPAYPSYRNFGGADSGTGYAQRKHWCPLFERYKVDLVLEHHDHTFKRSIPLTNGLYDKNGVTYLGDGSWGQIRPLNEPSLRPYLAKISSTNHLTTHRIEGEDRFHVALTETGKVTDVCHTVSKRPSRRG
ncbi:metallophosphoesterase [Planctomicrobium sp. SH661]|uniref:metallophosphoesterase n=1 Tax=Planctomicrobium sp. SH661 TaxID=3448124 RepID=UPI003F5CB052